MVERGSLTILGSSGNARTASEATSTAELQKAAAAMVKESKNNCSDMTRMFAKAGTSGKFPGNVESWLAISRFKVGFIINAKPLTPTSI